MKSQWMIVCGLIFAFITAIVAVNNISNVTLDYLFGEVEVSLILVISASVLIGGIIVALFGMRQPQREKKETSAQKKQLQQLHQEHGKLQEEHDKLREEQQKLHGEHQKLLEEQQRLIAENQHLRTKQEAAASLEATLNPNDVQI